MRVAATKQLPTSIVPQGVPPVEVAETEPSSASSPVLMRDAQVQVRDYNKFQKKQEAAQAGLLKGYGGDIGLKDPRYKETREKLVDFRRKRSRRDEYEEDEVRGERISTTITETGIPVRDMMNLVENVDTEKVFNKIAEFKVQMEAGGDNTVLIEELRGWIKKESSVIPVEVTGFGGAGAAQRAVESAAQAETPAFVPTPAKVISAPPPDERRRPEQVAAQLESQTMVEKEKPQMTMAAATGAVPYGVEGVAPNIAPAGLIPAGAGVAPVGVGAGVGAVYVTLPGTNLHFHFKGMEDFSNTLTAKVGSKLEEVVYNALNSGSGETRGQ